MPMSKMEMNGRIVVPKDIRRAVGAKLGTRFIWELAKDGSIHVVAKSKRPVAEECPQPDSDDALTGEGNA
ncbi:AbrB/MazE/SpoVT family DNA-binding domain-containing protein [Roseateles chitinivorans]|uniref:AbrB/MazE/SpoVT family DNA-binding domain-containing protein n=1 Tax=Roseateles chitinivorans TaxID=2917965 RepID=UPI003D665933